MRHNDKTDTRVVQPVAPSLYDAPGGRRRERWSWSGFIARITGGRLARLDGGSRPMPRYGFGAPPHERLVELLRTGDARFTVFLEGLSEFAEDFRRIPMQTNDEVAPFWLNGWLPAFDAAALYAFVARNNPARYVEIGSGNSTKFVRRAIRDHALRTRVISIDPCPRASIDTLCDRVIRAPFESVTDSELDQLVPGDIVFVDSSHRVLMNSDVTAFVLDVLPGLAPGVLVQFHDIWLPFDYPEHWRYWYFSEQYLLAAILLHAPDRFSIRFPCMYACVHPALSPIVGRLMDDIGVTGTRHGASFWLEIPDPGCKPERSGNATPATSA